MISDKAPMDHYALDRGDWAVRLTLDQARRIGIIERMAAGTWRDREDA